MRFMPVCTGRANNNKNCGLVDHYHRWPRVDLKAAMTARGPQQRWLGVYLWQL